MHAKRITALALAGVLTLIVGAALEVFSFEQEIVDGAL